MYCSLFFTVKHNTEKNRRFSVNLYQFSLKSIRLTFLIIIFYILVKHRHVCTEEDRRCNPIYYNLEMHYNSFRFIASLFITTIFSYTFRKIAPFSIKRRFKVHVYDVLQFTNSLNNKKTVSFVFLYSKIIKSSVFLSSVAATLFGACCKTAC